MVNDLDLLVKDNTELSG